MARFERGTVVDSVEGRAYMLQRRQADGVTLALDPATMQPLWESCTVERALKAIAVNIKGGDIEAGTKVGSLFRQLREKGTEKVAEIDDFLVEWLLGLVKAGTAVVDAFGYANAAVIKDQLQSILETSLADVKNEKALARTASRRKKTSPK